MANTPSLFENLQSNPVWDDAQWSIARITAQRLFNPSSPVDEDRLFTGRIRQVSDLLSTIYERGSHAILFGERGVGKSSLANTLKSKISPVVSNIKILKENCRPEDTFFTLWAKMLWGFSYEGVAVSDFLRNEDRHFIVVKILETLQVGTQYVLVFDEFDRIKDKKTKDAMADTIKHFSDYPQNITIIIVGVGSLIEDLFGAHPSIQRCCQQIPMPRMSALELDEIMAKRFPEIGLKPSQGVQTSLVELSQGLPGYVHLAARESALSAIRRRSRTIETVDFVEAIRESVRRAQESIISAYNKATYSAKDNMYREVLLACALAKTDERGKFSASDVRTALSNLLGRSVEISNFARHLWAFCDVSRGPVLRKTGKPKGFQYQFIDAPLQPYIVMAGKRDGLLES